MKTSLTIIGSCVSNQIIRFAASNSQNVYLVKGATTLINPFVLGTDAIPQIDTLLDSFEYDKDMTKLSTRLDFTRDFASFCRGKYLLLDISSLNNPIYEFTDQATEKTYYLSERPICDRSPSNKEKILSFANEHGYIVNRIDNPLFYYSDEKIKQFFVDFASIIQDYYSADHVIFAETAYTHMRIRFDKTLDLNGFNKNQTEKMHSFTKKYQEFLCSTLKLDSAHIIKELPNALADDEPKLHNNGSATHYSGLYYEYGYKALNLITDNLDYDVTVCELNNIMQEYITKYEQSKITFMESSCILLSKIKNFASYNYSLSEYISDSKESYLKTIKKYYGLIDVPVPFVEYTNLNAYTDMLIKNHCNYIIFMAVKDTSNKFFSEWINYNKLGIKTDLSKKKRRSYCAIVDLGKNYVKEKFNDDANEMKLNYQIFINEDNCSYIDDGKSMPFLPFKAYICNISSKAKYKESQFFWSRIMINNIDYSINKIGMNFVVFSPELQCVVDSFYVNFWNDKDLTIRRS